MQSGRAMPSRTLPPTRRPGCPRSHGRHGVLVAPVAQVVLGDRARPVGAPREDGLPLEADVPAQVRAEAPGQLRLGQPGDLRPQGAARENGEGDVPFGGAPREEARREKDAERRASLARGDQRPEPVQGMAHLVPAEPEEHGDDRRVLDLAEAGERAGPRGADLEGREAPGRKAPTRRSRIPRSLAGGAPQATRQRAPEPREHGAGLCAERHRTRRAARPRARWAAPGARCGRRRSGPSPEDPARGAGAPRRSRSG